MAFLAQTEQWIRLVVNWMEQCRHPAHIQSNENWYDKLPCDTPAYRIYQSTEESSSHRPRFHSYHQRTSPPLPPPPPHRNHNPITPNHHSNSIFVDLDGGGGGMAVKWRVGNQCVITDRLTSLWWTSNRLIAFQWAQRRGASFSSAVEPEPAEASRFGTAPSFPSLPPASPPLSFPIKEQMIFISSSFIKWIEQIQFMTRHIEIHIKAMELARKREREKYRNNNNYYLKSNKKKKNQQTNRKKKTENQEKEKHKKNLFHISKKERGKKFIITRHVLCSYTKRNNQ